MWGCRQDTGPDGGLWALAIRGIDVAALTGGELAAVWTLRGAPHLYRRGDLGRVAAATEPFSEADAAKRIFDAARQLRAAGISPLAALDTVAARMRELVSGPMVKGEVSGRLAELMEPPYLRSWRVTGPRCRAAPARRARLRAGTTARPGWRWMALLRV